VPSDNGKSSDPPSRAIALPAAMQPLRTGSEEPFMYCPRIAEGQSSRARVLREEFYLGVSTPERCVAKGCCRRAVQLTAWSVSTWRTKPSTIIT
jgi:hypothetical protein